VTHHLTLIAVFLGLALIIPLIMFLRVFRAVLTNIDSDAEARDEALAAKAAAAQQSAAGAAENKTEA
jgi:hypothetical protein